LAKAASNDQHSEAEPGSFGAFVTDRQTPQTSVTIVCISCILIQPDGCSLKSNNWHERRTTIE